MGLTKSTEYRKTHLDLAGVTKALGHPARVAILQFLVKRKSCICGDIVDELPLSQATVSQHLQELKNAGLIQGEVNGSSVCYCVNDKNWSRAEKLITEFFKSYDGKNCC